MLYAIARVLQTLGKKIERLGYEFRYKAFKLTPYFIKSYRKIPVKK